MTDVSHAADPSQDALLAGLNPQQAQAVTSQSPALLIAAGAGSGKTRVLTRRIAWILSHRRAWPSQILAITFTNKAANEMKERVTRLVGQEAGSMWISTFHSACLRLLHRFGKAVGLTSGFTIYDQQDSTRLMKLCETALNVDPKRLSPKAALAKIDGYKNSLITPQVALAQAGVDYTPGTGAKPPVFRAGDEEAMAACLYAEYQHRLAAANSVDFDDLIFKAVQLLRTDQEAADWAHHRFRYVLVDEYQDTNDAQYQFLREVAGYGAFRPQAAPASGEDGFAPDPARQAAKAHAWITVVGDSDQSIYAFRGANVRNILDFAKDFPTAQTIRLEQNYRSTQTILDAANAVIKNNSGRTPKHLWTDKGKGSPIVGFAAENAQEEASWVARRIAGLVGGDDISGSNFGVGDDTTYTYADIAVMYRANAQSRNLEEALVSAGIPYTIVGGTRFYERKEVKDGLAYLHAVANPADDVSVRRILNEPKRGIGARTEQAAQLWAGENNSSFWEALNHSGELGLGSAAVKKVDAFRDLIGTFAQAAQGQKPSETVHQVLEGSGLIAQYENSKDPQDQTRLDNLGQLQSLAAEYEKDNPDATLTDFLENTALVADADQVPDAGQGEVTLMTLHTSKGLEYPVVFLTGLEDGTFPSSLSFDDPEQLEEERRLAYVGITRARKRLFLSRAAERSQWGRTQELPPSRFLEEIPDTLIDWERKETSTEGVRRRWGSSLDGFDDGLGDDFGDFTDGFADGGPATFGGGSYGNRSYRRGSYGHGSSGYGSYGSGRFSSRRGRGSFDDDADEGFSGSSFGGRRYGSGSSSRSSRYVSGSRSGSYGSSSRGRSGSSYRSHGSGSHGTSKADLYRQVSRIHYSHRKPAPAPAPAASSAGHLTAADLRPGDKVTHDSYGLGTVRSVTDKGANSDAVIDFGASGVKRLMLRFAPLEKL